VCVWREKVKPRETHTHAECVCRVCVWGAGGLDGECEEGVCVV